MCCSCLQRAKEQPAIDSVHQGQRGRGLSTAPVCSLRTVVLCRMPWHPVDRSCAQVVQSRVEALVEALSPESQSTEFRPSLKFERGILWSEES